ncbi:MAG TPA: hypothetical protein DCE55_14600, partial [Planctomycetaceae bacterium]|nr:hypothetical protein [Planctomycetaceae bacterium]
MMEATCLVLDSTTLGLLRRGWVLIWGMWTAMDVASCSLRIFAQNTTRFMPIWESILSGKRRRQPSRKRAPRCARGSLKTSASREALPGPACRGWVGER